MLSKIFWGDNINILFEKKELTNFLPDVNMTFNEKLNAIVRFSLYLTIILILLKRNYLYFYILIFTMIITYFIHFMENKNEINKENLENEITKKNKSIKEINKLIGENKKE